MNWYYAQGDQRQGPITDSQLDALIAAGTINENTLVWREGMADWMPLKDARAMGSGGAGPASGVAIPAGWIRCTATGRYFPPEEIVYIDGKPYSAAAKPSILQGVMQGGALPTDDGSGRNGPPWEHRDQLGFFPALWQTIKGVLFDPVTTFDKMKRESGLGAPLLYLVITYTTGGMAALLYSVLFNTSILAMLPPESRRLAFYQPVFGVGMLLGGLIIIPIATVVFSFIVSGVLHLSLMICSGAKQPFETTFRTYCYAHGSATIFQLVPFCGGWISIIWTLVSLCIGLARTHEIGGGRAVLAVLLPLLLCCGGFIFTMVAIIGAAAASQGVHH